NHGETIAHHFERAGHHVARDQRMHDNTTKQGLHASRPSGNGRRNVQGHSSATETDRWSSGVGRHGVRSATTSSRAPLTPSLHGSSSPPLLSSLLSLQLAPFTQHPRRPSKWTSGVRGFLKRSLRYANRRSAD